jgi:hypothetical protein
MEGMTMKPIRKTLTVRIRQDAWAYIRALADEHHESMGRVVDMLAGQHMLAHVIKPKKGRKS